MEPGQPHIQVPSSHKQEQQPASDAPSSKPQDQNQEMPLSSSNTYKAPFCKIEDPRYTPVRGGYIVNFFSGHTLEQHSTAVGRNMQPHVGRVIPIRSEDRFYYTGHEINGELLDLIRIDKGVKSVREECQGRWPQGWNEGEEGIPQMFAVTGYSAPG